MCPNSSAYKDTSHTGPGTPPPCPHFHLIKTNFEDPHLQIQWPHSEVMELGASTYDSGGEII